MNDQQKPASAQDVPMTGMQKAGWFVFVIVNCFCADEMVPVWGIFHKTYFA
jgi:hypothetical protein